MKEMRLFAQRITAIVLCFSMMMGMIPFYGIKSLAVAPDISTLGEIGGYLQGALQTIEKTYAERKFNYVQGHGFAAERANNLSDVLRGEKAVVVGDNNVKNGPDRQILNRDGATMFIQDKYCATASESLNAAFDSVTGAESWAGACDRGDCKCLGKGCFHSNPQCIWRKCSRSYIQPNRSTGGWYFAESNYYIGRCCGRAFGE